MSRAGRKEERVAGGTLTDDGTVSVMTIVQKTLLRIAGAAAVTAVLVGSAAAQFPMPSVNLEQEKVRTPQEVERDQAIDRAYKSATKKIPDKESANDPWSGVRSASPAAGPAKKTLQASPNKKQQLSQGAKKHGE